jgi:hypothetical protein
MAHMLINLRHVPEDEQNEIRGLLDENEIKYYETNAGFWGIGTVAIWLSSDEQLVTAKALLQDYQQERSIRVRAEYEEAKKNGEAHTILSTFKTQPVLFTLYLALIALILGFFLLPFISLV